MSTIAYTFDVQTREYIYQYDREENTLTTIGDDRTLDEVLPEKEGFARLRNLDNTEWYYVIDHRTKSQYSIIDGAESTIDYTGDIQPGFTFGPRPAAYYVFDEPSQSWIIDKALEADYLATLKASKKIELRTARDARINRNDAITTNAGTFNIDQSGLAYLNGELINAQAIGAGDDEIITTYTNTDLDDVDLTKSQVLSLSTQKNEIKKQVGAYYTTLIGQVNDAQTINEVNLIVWADDIKQAKEV